MACAINDTDATGERNGISCHSRYAPRKEAERLVDSSIGGKRPAVVFIAGGGLNYIGLVVAQRFPKAIIVSMQPCEDFNGLELAPAAYCWSPSCARTPFSVAAEALSGHHASGGVAVIEWSPVLSRYPEQSGRIRRAIRDALEAASSDAATSAFWARRWLRNCVRFTSAVSNNHSIVPGSSTIVIACAGPGLMDTLREIAIMREKIGLWALSSALPALRRYGIEPDLVIATDPGFWSAAHLRTAAGSKIPVAMPPSAYAPASILETSPIVALDTGLSFERAALGALGLRGLEAEAAGSAAGTALSMALSATSGPVVLAGYDLAARASDDHARPYAFDILDELASSRIMPFVSSRSTRIFDTFQVTAGSWRLSRAFSAYASTIRATAADENRVYRVSGSPVDTGMQRAGPGDMPAAGGTTPLIVSKPSPTGTRHSRSAAMQSMLDDLVDHAFEDAREAVEHTVPVPYSAALIFKALAPRDSAAFIAEAARASASETDMATLEPAVRAAAAAMSGMSAC